MNPLLSDPLPPSPAVETAPSAGAGPTRLFLTHPAGGQPSGRRPELLALLGLVALSLAAFFQVLSFDFVTYDDPKYVTDNLLVQAGLTPAGVWWALTDLTTGNWHPLTWFSLMLDASWCGLNPAGYHLTNLLLHTAAGVCLYAWLRLVARRRGPAGERWLQPSLWVAGMFLVHPTHVESVSWVTERKDVLSAVALFSCLLAYTSYAGPDEVGRRVSRRVWYGLALAAFAGGLMAKSVLVGLPVILCALDVWPLQRWAPDQPAAGAAARWRRVASLGAEKLPFLALALGACLLTMVANAYHAPLVPEPVTLAQRFENVVLSDAVYLKRTFWPFGLSAFYLSPRLSWPAWEIGVSFVAVFAVTGLVLWSSRRHPYLLVGWLWYLVLLFPVSGVVPVGNQFVPDRFVYLPHVGLLVMIAGLVVEARDRWSAGGPGGLLPRWVVPVGASLSLVACAVLAHLQANTWMDSVALYRRGLAVGGPKERINVLLGEHYARSGQLEAAEDCFLQAVRALPGDKVALAKFGFLRLKQERWEAAAELLGQGFHQDPNDPILTNNLGYALFRTGRDQAAYLAYRRSLRLRPRFGLPHLNLAQWWQARGEDERAAAEYETALQEQPDWPQALCALGTLAALGGKEGRPRPDPARALQLAARAVKVTSGEPSSLACLALAHAASGHWREAESLTQEMISSQAVPRDHSLDLSRLGERLVAYHAHRLPVR